MTLHNSRQNIAMTIRASLHTGSGLMSHKMPVAPVFALDFINPQQRKRKMYTLIDCTNYRVIATHISYRALSALAYIQYANVDVVVMPCNENKPFAQFDTDQLNALADSAMAREATAFKTGEYTYGDVIARTRLIIEAAPNLRLPFTAEKLEEQAEKIAPDDERPWAIDASGIAKPAKRWVNDPQRNRARVGINGTAQQLHPKGNPPASALRAPNRVPVDDPAHPMTAKADGASYADFIAEGWTDALLIEHGYMEAPPALERKMTKKAKGVTYEEFIAEGWTDELLIQHGYMKS